MLDQKVLVAHHTEMFFSIIRNRLKFSLFLLKNLPAAYFSGVRIKGANEQSCAVTIPFKWFTTNPFQSTYFACLSMAAEMSTGVLAMAHVYKRKPGVSMLVTAVESSYHKKATGLTTFHCNDGDIIRQAIETAIATNVAQSIKAKSTGYNHLNEVVAEFWMVIQG
jgi:hypothetical protein